MKKYFLTLFALVFSSMLVAGDSDSGRIDFNGGAGQRFMDLQTETTRTDYRWVQVPYIERVCRDETRYRQVCQTGPGRQICRTQPSRQVCTNRPGRRVCRTRPDGRQICRTRPDRRVCRTIPGQRICRHQPGQRICRQVPYNERVCQNVTRYRQERQAYTVVDTRTNARLTFDFSERAFAFLGVSLEIRAELYKDQLSVTAFDHSTPGVLISDQATTNRSGQRENLTITEHHKVDIFNSEYLFSPLRGSLHANDVYQNELILRLSKIHYIEELSFDLTIKKNGQVLFSRPITMSDFKVINNNDQSSALLINLRELGVKVPTDSIIDIGLGIHLQPSKYANASHYENWSKMHSLSVMVK